MKLNSVFYSPGVTDRMKESVEDDLPLRHRLKMRSETFAKRFIARYNIYA